MKKIAFVLIGVVVLAVIVMILFARNNSNELKQLSPLQVQMNALDWQIKIAREEINRHRLVATNAETEAQVFLPTAWDKYVAKIQEVEKNEIAIKALEDRIRLLEQQKQDLIKGEKEKEQNSEHHS